MTLWLLIGAAGWSIAGLSFWVGMLVHSPPPCWESRGRVEGWDSMLYFYLPFCLAAGPINWALFWWMRRR